MSRAAFVLPIRSDRLDEYDAAHQNVWPELCDAIRGAGIGNYTIFRYGNLAIGYLEAKDVSSSFAALGETDVNARWQDAMSELLDDRVDGHGPESLTEIFHLE